MKGSIWPLLLLNLTACAPKASPEVVTQILRVGDLEVNISAPQWVTRQKLYPLKVTYTNRGGQAIKFSDLLDCSYVWVEGVDKKVSPTSEFGCPTRPAPQLNLAPNESHSGSSQGIIAGFPKGRYHISPQSLRGVLPQVMENGGRLQKIEMMPPAQEIRFQIR